MLKSHRIIVDQLGFPIVINYKSYSDVPTVVKYCNNSTLQIYDKEQVSLSKLEELVKILNNDGHIYDDVIKPLKIIDLY